MAKRRRRKRTRRGEHHLIGCDPSPTCPVCIAMAQLGLLDWIEVSICGDATAWPKLPDQPSSMWLPRRSTLESLGELMFELCPALGDCALVARINGERSSFARVLRHGDKVTFGIDAPVAGQLSA